MSAPPHAVMVKQARWERAEKLRQMREAGATFAECAAHFGVSKDRARQIYERQLRHIKQYGDKSPFQVWRHRV